MAVDDEALTSMLRARSRRADFALDAAAFTATLPQQNRRAPTTSTLVLGTALLSVALVVGAWGLSGSGRDPRPTGTWQSEQTVGTGPVGSDTCVAIELTDEAYESGHVQLWWWAPGKGGCRFATSSPMESTASLTSIQVSGITPVDSHEAFRIELTLDILPEGTETLAFVIDPSRTGSDETKLLGDGGAAADGQPLSFVSVSAPDVELPGGGPAPTPESE